MEKIGIIRELDNLGRLVICLMIIEPSWFEMANSPQYCVKKA